MNKKILTIILCSLLLHISISAQDKFKAGSEPTGFKGMQWGTHISAFSGMELTESTPGNAAFGKIYPGTTLPKMPGTTAEKSYRNENDLLQIEGVSLDEINYLFRNDKFSGVIIVSHGREAFEQLKKALFAKYGEGKFETSAGSPIGVYVWQGEKTKVMLTLIIGDAVGLLISSMETEREIEKARQEARNPLIDKIYRYAGLVWSVEAFNFSNLLNELQGTEILIGKYTKEEWETTCDKSSDQTNDLLKRSDRAVCNAAGALYFEDVSFCDKLPYVKNFSHEQDLKTKCVTAIALKKKDKSICSTGGIDDNSCKARLDREFPSKTTFKNSVGRHILLPAGVTLEKAKEIVEAIPKDEILREALQKTSNINPNHYSLTVARDRYKITVMVYYNDDYNAASRILDYIRDTTEKYINDFLKNKINK
ncbi:MAG: hypothetical protein Q8O30_11360 [Candidatus Omnitrophota bacterium]|nr:hypothetical protein [Candidatus Omnitrophota bacterium]